MAGSFGSHAFAMVGNALLMILSWDSTPLTIVMSPPMRSFLSICASEDLPEPCVQEQNVSRRNGGSQECVGNIGQLLNFPSDRQFQDVLGCALGIASGRKRHILGMSKSKCFCTHSMFLLTLSLSRMLFTTAHTLAFGVL